MKKYIVTAFIFAAAATAVLYSCKKTSNKIEGYYYADSAVAHLKIVQASAFFNSATGKQDTFHVYANGGRVTNAALSYGSIFPGTASNTYLSLPAGAQSI